MSTIDSAADKDAATASRTVWKGPFDETDKYGQLTGHKYVRCRDCGREAMVGREEFAEHRDGCRFGDSA